MISYVKVYGPPLFEAIKALEKIAVDMPEVCIMNNAIKLYWSQPDYIGSNVGDPALVSNAVKRVKDFFGIEDIPEARCKTIISNSGETLGEYDFFFEWFTKPDVVQVEDLIKRIDETLAPLGVKYTLVTK